MREEIAHMFVAILIYLGPVILQIALSRMKRPWPGLILPGLCALYSLFGLFALGDILYALVVMNIPTVIFLLIYISQHESFGERDRRTKEEGEKSRKREPEAIHIQDWE